MEELPQLLKHNPNIQTINLEFSEIDSLDPLLPFLCQFPRLKELLLFGNRLELLPQDLSKLKTLEKLDISNNLIDNISQTIPGLQSLPKLIELHITLQSHQEEDLIIKSLHLSNLNGNPIETHSLPPIASEDDDKDIVKSLLPCESSGFFNEESSLNQDYLEKIAGIYDEIRTMWVKQDKTKDELLAADFDEGLKVIMGELSDILKDSHQEYLVNVYSLKAKFELALMCQQKLIDLIYKKNESVGSKIRETNEILVEVFRDTIKSLIGIQPKLQKKILTMKAEVNHFQSESNDVIEAADQIQKEALVIKESKEQLWRRYQEEREEMLAEIEALQEENKRYLDTIVRHSKSFADNALAGGGSSQRYGGEEVKEEFDKKYSVSTYSKQSGKILSLRQLKEVIEEIYASKIKYDERCLNGKMPRETMEQHMYNYLNKKYGLKSLVLDTAASIAASVKKHSPHDNDVAVFGLILRNECDEEFRLVQLQVRKTALDLLKMGLRTKFPLKSNADIIEIVNEKSSGHLNEDEWNEIVRFMYNESDAEYIIELLYNTKVKEDNGEKPKGKISREEAIILREKERSLRNRILYVDLVNVLLDFQLKGHDRFLRNFVRIFRRVDSNSDGIISEKEFIKLIGCLDLGFGQEDCGRLLQVIDPFDNQLITFSECVALFSTELVPGESVPILQKLAGEEN